VLTLQVLALSIFKEEADINGIFIN